MSDSNAIMALKNAWTGAIQTSEALRVEAATASQIPDNAPLERVDLEKLHHLALANANAAQALRGLIEQLRRSTSNSFQ